MAGERREHGPAARRDRVRGAGDSEASPDYFAGCLLRTATTMSRMARLDAAAATSSSISDWCVDPATVRWKLLYLDRFGEAGGHSERALQVGRATGQDQLLPGVNATLGVACCMLRRLAEAAELLDAAIEAGRLSGNPQALAWALFCRAFVAVPAGDTQVAIATAEQSLDLATAGGQSVIAARAASVLAIARINAESRHARPNPCAA